MTAAARQHHAGQRRQPDQEQFPEMRIDHQATDFELIGKAVWMGKRL